MNDEYVKKGFKDRREYLFYLSKLYDIGLDEVISLAESIGKDKDFDQLIIEIKEYVKERYV